MSKSIISNERCCYLCGQTVYLHRHHVLYGRGRRHLSEKYGLWVYLCPFHHNMSKWGVHNNKEADDLLKRVAQTCFERSHSREEFMQIFGRNYL